VTYNVSSRTLNLTHSRTNVFADRQRRRLKLLMVWLEACLALLSAYLSA